MEIFGNSEIRAQTEEMLRCVASNLSQSVAETLETPTHSCLNTASLKVPAGVNMQICGHTGKIQDESYFVHHCVFVQFRERDELARILKAWMQPQSSSILISKAWDYRVRQHLGTRYNSKDGSFDWDLNMKLHEKGVFKSRQKSQNYRLVYHGQKGACVSICSLHLQCGVIHKHQYARWRERGVAFELREGVYELNNPSLLSFRVFNQVGF